MSPGTTLAFWHTTLEFGTSSRAGPKLAEEKGAQQNSTRNKMDITEGKKTKTYPSDMQESQSPKRRAAPHSCRTAHLLTASTDNAACH
ncbi:Hypothetical predicted protein, partial [Pelobates cultripes]